MPVFDELNRRKRLEDPEVRQAKRITRAEGKTKKSHSSSVSIRAFQKASRAIGIIFVVGGTLVLAYFVVQAVKLYIGG